MSITYRDIYMKKGDYILIILSLFFINGLVKFNSNEPAFMFSVAGLMIAGGRFLYLICKKLTSRR